jgi:hypothetical protein
MNEKFPEHFFMGMLVIALALVGVGWFTSSAIKSAKRSNDTITVTGSARKTIRSDYATWAFTVHCLSPEMPQAYECMQKRSARVKEFLKSLHIPDSSLEISTITPEQVFGNSGKRAMKGDYSGPTNEFIGFKCKQRYVIHTTLVDSVKKWSESVSTLIPELVEIFPEQIQYFYNKISDLRGDMLSAATLDAKSRANKIAESAGGKIGGVRNARMGVMQVTVPNSRDVSDYGVYDTSTLDKDVLAVVTVSFAVE